MTINMENYYFSSETAEDRDISSNKNQVLTLEKIKLNADQRRELQYQFWYWTL